MEDVVLRERVIERRRSGYSVCAQLSGFSRKPGGFNERRISDSDHHRNATGDLPASKLDNLIADGRGQSRRFAGCAERKQAMYASCNQMFNEPFKTFSVESPLIFKRRNYRGDDSVKERCCVRHNSSFR